MNHFARLHLVGRITYYLGWISLVCGGLVHLRIGQAMFLSLDLTKRNLFEVAVVCFLICIASELRANAPAEQQVSAPVVKRAAA